VASNFSLFDDWWELNLEVSNDDSVVASTDLWTRFKQENKLMISEMNITGDKFKQYIKTKVPLSSIILRNKNANSAFDVKGLKMSDIEKKVNEKMEEVKEKIAVELNLELNEEVIKNNKKKVVKKGKIEVYFDEKLDKKIITDYSEKNKDIMLLSKEYNFRPWEIVSLLVRYKVINKRDEAIGYDIYKKTDEYKQKIKN